MPSTRLLIDYTPGEECRVALVEDGKLQEFHEERFDAVSRVGNIYIGKVHNVESAIQAAFVDFGVNDNGFLHVSDLHPSLFPGEDDETTERVGKKTPRRDRPPIQQCLKRGQEVAVQVIKEGVGTKGPTLTSYLSIPGRYLVMMPAMDKVGVSRKVEDDDLRRRMRKILDELDLPEGFGFILRTAGLERTKTELKRDLAYLQRLWKDMEARRRKGRAPKLLYSESDLLVRTLRDQLTTDIHEVVINSRSALDRAAKFMKIVAPRGQSKLVEYTGKQPLFHAFGIEPQIAAMHAREVPLPSGGRLVIDETEALVAIDVNSGKSRSARDAETNAYRTNMEAVDEISRQLRLRDLGGLVINDLIDMRDIKHRRKVEARFRDRLKKDRARTTILPISSFGILEMTRQRMRSSHERTHFTVCPTCTGRGLVQRPTSVAADALRELMSILHHDRVHKVELVVSARVAGELLSSRRKALNRVERTCGKLVEVRISDTLPIDRVAFYAYDDAGADVDISRLQMPKAPEKDLAPWDMGKGDDNWAADLQDEHAEIAEEEIDDAAEEVVDPDSYELQLDDISDDNAEQRPKKKRRRRRRRGKGGGDKQDTPQSSDESSDDDADETSAQGDSKQDSEDSDSDEAPRKKRRRRRRRRKSGGESGEQSQDSPQEDSSDEDDTPSEPEGEQDAPESDDEQSDEAPKKKRRRRGGRSRRKKTGTAADGSDGDAPSDDGSESNVEDRAEERTPEPEASSDDDDGPPKKKRRSRSRKKTTTKKSADEGATPNGDAPAKDAKSDAAPKKKVRSLYASRRKLLPSERGNVSRDE